MAKSLGAYLMQCLKVFLHVIRAEGLRYVEKLLLIFQTTEINFSTFGEVLKTCKHCSAIMSR